MPTGVQARATAPGRRRRRADSGRTGLEFLPNFSKFASGASSFFGNLLKGLNLPLVLLQKVIGQLLITLHAESELQGTLIMLATLVQYTDKRT